MTLLWSKLLEGKFLSATVNQGSGIESTAAGTGVGVLSAPLLRCRNSKRITVLRPELSPASAVASDHTSRFFGANGPTMSLQQKAFKRPFGLICT